MLDQPPAVGFALPSPLRRRVVVVSPLVGSGAWLVLRAEELGCFKNHLDEVFVT